MKTEQRQKINKLKEFFWHVRVYYEDTDSGNVVYYANYLKYMERARTEMLRSLGFEQDELQQKQNLIFVVKNVNINYIRAARFNNQLKIATKISKIGKASINFKQNIYRLNAQNKVEQPRLTSAEITIACISAKQFTLQAIPKIMTEKIKQEYYCGS